ncbi:hypothetical protein V7E39_09465 [Bacillus sp. B38]|uniref:hypothetical protein n=1 Tax=Bacillus sp. B38 TaxID=218305 RepID=UPI003C7B63E8
MNRTFGRSKNMIRYLEKMDYRENPTSFRKRKNGGVFGKSIIYQEKFKNAIRQKHNEQELNQIKERLDLDIETNKDTSFFQGHTITVIITTLTIIFTIAMGFINLLGQVITAFSNNIVSVKVKAKISDEEKLKFIRNTFISVTKSIFNEEMFTTLLYTVLKCVVIVVVGIGLLAILYTRQIKKKRFYFKLIKESLDEIEKENKNKEN